MKPGSDRGWTWLTSSSRPVSSLEGISGIIEAFPGAHHERALHE